MSDVQITVHPEARIDRIAPELHGHFSEHLGRCVYDGLYHDPSSTKTGVRSDVASLLSALDIPVLRWPGGCFADDYHWEDGIGPQEDRPGRRNLFWAQGREELPEEPNSFGTDEFLQLCEQIGTEPYLAVNVGSGDPQQATDWVEYCNYDGETELADRRRENGHPEPYGVKYWGIGNENWGCGGQMTPEQYAREYRKFATYVGSMDKLLLDHDLELIACGFEGHEWNRRFMEEIGTNAWGVEFPLDHLTLHHYYGRTITIEEADTDAYDTFLCEALEIESHIERIGAAINAVATTRDIGVIIDEWGAWHPEAVAESGLEQPGTVIDGVSAAAVLDIFNHHSDVMTMSNIAQTVNVLHCLVETEGENAWARPTYRVFDLYAPHKGNTAVETSIATPTRAVDDDELPLVGGSASVADEETYLTLTNLDHASAHAVDVTLTGEVTTNDVSGSLLFGDQSADTVVNASNEDDFEATTLDCMTVADHTLSVELPPLSVAGIAVR
ncbi:alpha-N-arabinofuranosidase [Halocatena halophila]|uniref:alpha-N-arabinofuranosidase n=1 Tax=Halocatena halophila TaxID=2814576 RepID=UPI002ED64730